MQGRLAARYNAASDAGWSSQVARRAHNPEVAGSNPAPATRKAPETGLLFFSETQAAFSDCFFRSGLKCAHDVHRVLALHRCCHRGLPLDRHRQPMTFARRHGISLFFGAILLASLVGQSFAGLHQFNADAIEHESQTYSWLRYVTSSEFGGDVLENWQSEFPVLPLHLRDGLAARARLERIQERGRRRVDERPEPVRGGVWENETAEQGGRRGRGGTVV